MFTRVFLLFSIKVLPWSVRLWGNTPEGDCFAMKHTRKPLGCNGWKYRVRSIRKALKRIRHLKRNTNLRKHNGKPLTCQIWRQVLIFWLWSVLDQICQALKLCSVLSSGSRLETTPYLAPKLKQSLGWIQELTSAATPFSLDIPDETKERDSFKHWRTKAMREGSHKKQRMCPKQIF